jgi:hypothetical protein
MYQTCEKNNLVPIIFGENILEIFYNFQDT